MEPEGSSPHSQHPAACPYPEPDRSSPCPCLTSGTHILILSSHLRLGLPVDFLPSGFPTKTLYATLFSPFVLHSLPNPFPLLSFYRRISPVPRLLRLFRNMVMFLRWGVVSTSPNPQAGGPPIVGCPTASSIYSPLPSISGGRSSIRHLRTRHAMVTGTQIKGQMITHVLTDEEHYM